VKNVNSRFTAEQAFAHPWIQDQESLKVDNLNEGTFEEMEKTLNHARVQKVVLLYMSQHTQQKNLTLLQDSFNKIDPDKKKKVAPE